MLYFYYLVLMVEVIGQICPKTGIPEQCSHLFAPFALFALLEKNPCSLFALFAPVRCSRCSHLFAVRTVRTCLLVRPVRCSHCSHQFACSHCSLFALFAPVCLFALFAVRTVRIYSFVRCSHLFSFEKASRSHCSCLQISIYYMRTNYMRTYDLQSQNLFYTHKKDLAQL